MEITASNMEKLTWQAKVDLLRKIVEGAVSLDEINEDAGAVNLILFHVLDQLDEADQDDAFGSRGWRHNILGED